MSKKRSRKVNLELCPMVGEIVAEDNRIEALASTLHTADEYHL